MLKEIKSPNVKKILPLQIAKHLRIFNPDDFMIEDHGQRIFEFNYVGRCNAKEIKQTIKEDFSNHESRNCIYNVDVTGIKSDKGVGSQRFCTMNKALAEYLNEVIVGRAVVDRIPGYKVIGVSQYFRFMRYLSGGEHFPHYDSDFVLNPGNIMETATKYSMVMYFTNCESGEFAFVNDPRKDHKNSDWERQATEEEIELKISPAALKILIFPHTLCHTVLPFTDECHERIICRGDIYFQQEIYR